MCEVTHNQARPSEPCAVNSSEAIWACRSRGRALFIRTLPHNSAHPQRSYHAPHCSAVGLRGDRHSVQVLLSWEGLRESISDSMGAASALPVPLTRMNPWGPTTNTGDSVP